MSDRIIKIIPCDPLYIPPAENQLQAEAAIRSSFPDADAIAIATTESVQFVDAGENWGEIRCPSCDALMDEEWWSNAMDKAYEGNFLNLEVAPHCCGTKVSLNKLKYEFPVGFSRFSIEALNPGKSKLEDDTLKNVEAILGCELKVISAYL